MVLLRHLIKLLKLRPFNTHQQLACVNLHLPKYKGSGTQGSPSHGFLSASVTDTAQPSLLPLPTGLLGPSLFLHPFLLLNVNFESTSLLNQYELLI